MAEALGFRICSDFLFSLDRDSTHLPQDRTPLFEERGLVLLCVFGFRRDQSFTGFLFLSVKAAPAVAVMSPPRAVKSVVPMPPV